MHVAEQFEPANVLVDRIVVLGPALEFVPNLVERLSPYISRHHGHEFLRRLPRPTSPSL